MKFIPTKLILILFIIFIGCDSYEKRFFEQQYEEQPDAIAYSEVKYHRINGSRERVKQLEYDKGDILRKEIFFGDKFINKIRLYDKEGVIAKEEVFDVDSKDRLSGQRIIYYSSGNKKEEYDFNHGEKNGYYTSYYRNGALQSDLEYSGGRLIGSCSWYYPSGNLMKIQEFFNKEFYQIQYYENGNKKSEGSLLFNNNYETNFISDNFVGDSFIGHWVFYDKQGKITEENDY